MREKTDGLKVLSDQIDIALNSAASLQLTTLVYILDMARLELEAAVESDCTCAGRAKLKSAG